MKKSLIFVLVLITCSAGLFFVSSCKKDKTTATGTLTLHLHSNIDTNEIDLGKVYRDADGRQIQLNTAQFYISNVHLKKADGSDYALNGAYILKMVEQEQYVVGTAPVGDYKSVSFDVGVDAATNHKDPTSFSASSPLSSKDNSRWFGSTDQGYIFMNVNGLVDTSTGHNGAVNFPISYKIGSDAWLTHVTMPDHSDNFTMTENQTMLIHVVCDYGALLKGVQFKTESTTSPTTNAAVGQKIVANIPSMFTYEE